MPTGAVWPRRLVSVFASPSTVCLLLAIPLTLLPRRCVRSSAAPVAFSLPSPTTSVASSSPTVALFLGARALWRRFRSRGRLLHNLYQWAHESELLQREMLCRRATCTIQSAIGLIYTYAHVRKM